MDHLCKEFRESLAYNSNDRANSMTSLRCAILPMVQFAVHAMVKIARQKYQARTMKLAKKVFIRGAK